MVLGFALNTEVPGVCIHPSAPFMSLVLKVGTMAKCYDLSNFDKGQIVRVT